ncbi:MAG: hypothetical protein ACRDIC_18875 [bacterium]
MSRRALTLSWGEPRREYSFGGTKQLIYGDSSFVYVKNGIVVHWQVIR